MYDVTIIGAGPGGYEAALRAAELGMQTALVEKREIGGTCLNRGCIPTKALLHAAELFEMTRAAGMFGVEAGEARFDTATAYQRKDAVVQTLREGVEEALTAAGVRVYRGWGRICGTGRVSVQSDEGETEIETKRILIATGARPSRPPIPGLELEGVVTSDELLRGMTGLPDSIVIIGGGVIGVEFAGFFLNLGCRVTIVEGMNRLLPQMDRDIGQGLAQLLKKRGAEIAANAMVNRVEKTEAGMRVRYTCKGEERSAEGALVLCAIGRVPNTEGLFKDGIAPEMNGRAIAVNERYETSIPGVYAIGDVSSRIQLAHVASAQGRNCVEGMLGLRPTAELSCVPSGIYCTPEISSVGLTADEARAAGREAVSVRTVLSGNGRNVILGGERAFVKLTADRDTHRLLGAQLMCPRATDIISQFTEAIVNGLTVEQMLAVVRPHPTFEEGVQGALHELKRKLGG